MSDYLLFATLSNLGYPPSRVSRAVSALQGRDDPVVDDDDQIGPPLEWHPEPEPFEPHPSDEEWLARRPTDADLEAMARHAAWLDHLEGLARVTDEDLIAAGLPVG
jgi:hypothetical protein